jgi:hypothetical protein
VRHSSSSSYPHLVEAGLAIQPDEIWQGANPLVGNHSRTHEESHRSQEGRLQERKAQHNRHFCHQGYDYEGNDDFTTSSFPPTPQPRPTPPNTAQHRPTPLDSLVDSDADRITIDK